MPANQYYAKAQLVAEVKALFLPAIERYKDDPESMFSSFLGEAIFSSKENPLRVAISGPSDKNEAAHLSASKAKDYAIIMQMPDDFPMALLADAYNKRYGKPFISEFDFDDSPHQTIFRTEKGAYITRTVTLPLDTLLASRENQPSRARPGGGST